MATGQPAAGGESDRLVRSATSSARARQLTPQASPKKEVPMDLDRHLVRPITEETGTRAAFGMVVGTLAGAAIALPLLVGVFGL